MRTWFWTLVLTLSAGSALASEGTLSSTTTATTSARYPVAVDKNGDGFTDVEELSAYHARRVWARWLRASLPSG